MYVRSIQLKNYRNHKELKFNNFKKTNVVTGPNASGKSNIMEAMLRFNAHNQQGGDPIRFGSDMAVVQIEVQKGNGRAKHLLVAEKNNEKTIVSKKQPLGPLPIVCFTPADGDLFGGGPRQRRQFLDSACSLFKKRYARELLEYQRVVRQKNDLLKRGAANKELLETFNYQLVEKAEKIIKERVGFLREASPAIKELYRQLTGEEKDVEAGYLGRTDIKQPRKSLFDQLEQKAELESIRGCCLVGPHRDDFSLAVNGVDVATFGSQGEKRTGCLALKISLLQLLQKAGVKPLLILDDALSELDAARRKLLFQTVQHCEQVFITATDVDGLGLDKNHVGQFELGPP